ncbi:prepilin peptidase [Rathayibacter sp. CAU 1779]
MSVPVLSSRRLLSPFVRRAAWQTPLAAALVVTAVWAVGWRFELVGCLYLALVTPELCRVDATEHRLPNALVLPGLAFASVGVVFGWLATGRAPVGALLTTLAVGGFFLLVVIAGGMGMGDAKLAAVLALAGASVSILVVVGAVVLGFIVAGGAALARLAMRGGSGDIAFGPYLLGGFWVSLAVLPFLG